MIREIMNKIIWDKRENLKNYEITFLHRGAYEDKIRIPFSSIDKVSSSWFTYMLEDGERLIPFHRIIEIRNVKTGKLVCSRKHIKN